MWEDRCLSATRRKSLSDDLLFFGRVRLCFIGLIRLRDADHTGLWFAALHKPADSLLCGLLTVLGGHYPINLAAPPGYIGNVGLLGLVVKTNLFCKGVVCNWRGHNQETDEAPDEKTC